MLNKLTTLIMILSVAFLANVQTAYAVNLPDPSGSFDGIDLTQEFDDFLVYSAPFLDEANLINLGAAGVGGFDITIFTQAGGIDNVNIGTNSNYTFEDPTGTPVGGPPAGQTFSGTWGEGDASINGPVLVDSVVNYLQEQFGDPNASIPVFTFDLVEPGSGATSSVQVAVEFVVYDPSSGTVVESWAFDNTDDGTFNNPLSLITFPGSTTLTGTSGTEYNINNATGSGAFDFLLFSPTMTLADYYGQGYELHVFGNLALAHGGGEELTISGSFTVPGGGGGTVPTPSVPEPGTMALMGIGLAGLAARRKLMK